MSALEAVTVEPEIDETLEHDLPWLHAQVSAIGVADYFRHDDGTWTVHLKLPTDRPGVMARVYSRYDHRTLTEALRDVLAKCR